MDPFFLQWGLILVVVISMYFGILVSFYIGWKRLKNHPLHMNPVNSKVSVIIPFHNEENGLNNCCLGLIQQELNGLQTEFILVDDFSTDSSLEIAEKFALKYPSFSVTKNKIRGKKGALETGLQQATSEIIVITDADCNYPKRWLYSMVTYFETYQPNMIIGPMKLETGNSFFQKFQAWEYSSLMGTTAGSAGLNRPIMCNGANLAFRKSIYNKLPDPFKRTYRSGDDMFLLHQFKNIDRHKIHYLKSHETLVIAKGATNLKDFLKQRFRWTSKAPGYRDGDTIFVGVLVTFTHMLLFALLGLSFISVPYLFLFFGFLFIKTLLDGWFLTRMNNLFNQSLPLIYLPVFEGIYALYVLVSVTSVLFTKKLRGQ